MNSSLDTIHHVAIAVADIEESLRWYKSSFSCEVSYRDATQAILQFANVRLVLVLPSQERTHVGYVRDDAETLGELFEQKDGTFATFVADPSGNPVKIVSSDSIAS